MRAMETGSVAERRLRRHRERLGTLGRPLVFEDGLSIFHLPGGERPRELVISICGGNLRLGGVPEEEMLGIARSAGRRAALVVADASLSSFTDPALLDRLGAEVSRMVDALGGPRVLVVGSSIGGHGALHLARRLGAEVALGFAPIYSTDIRVHRESRWREAQRRLHPAGMATIGDDLSPDCRYVAIYAADEPAERRHYAALSRVPGMEVHLIRRGGHHVPRRLSRARVLAEVVEAVFAGGPMPGGFEALLADEATAAQARDIIAGEIAPDGRPYGRFIHPTMPPPRAAARHAAGAPSS